MKAKTNRKVSGAGIRLRVLGDFGPFSRAGKSIGYMIEARGQKFLVDCGSPLFNQIGGHGFKDISGIIITHCHDDHKRWFTDIALFHMYAPDIRRKVFVMTSEDVWNELKASSMAAMDRSLSHDSNRIVDIAFEDYVDYRHIGPQARYVIHNETDSDGVTRLSVRDREGNTLTPDRAKVVISPKSGRPRMLFRDPGCGAWVEPEAYYPFSSSTFYEPDQRIYDKDGVTIEAVNAPVWHGIAGIGLRFKADGETLLLTSDTVHDLRLWKHLSEIRSHQKPGMSPEEFERAGVIAGDINDYIERVWSAERYNDAVAAFAGAAVVQDVSLINSVVHTDYVSLDRTCLESASTILTHCPDRMTSEWKLCYAEKTYEVSDNKFHEMLDSGETMPLDADVYHKENGRYFVGYRNERGAYQLFHKNGILRIYLPGSHLPVDTGAELYRVDMFEVIGGGYYPVLSSPDESYEARADGRVELVVRGESGSTGSIAEDMRPSLTAARAQKR